MNLLNKTLFLLIFIIPLSGCDWFFSYMANESNKSKKTQNQGVENPVQKTLKDEVGGVYNTLEPQKMSPQKIKNFLSDGDAETKLQKAKLLLNKADNPKFLQDVFTQFSYADSMEIFELLKQDLGEEQFRAVINNREIQDGRLGNNFFDNLMVRINDHFDASKDDAKKVEYFLNQHYGFEHALKYKHINFSNFQKVYDGLSNDKSKSKFRKKILKALTSEGVFVNLNEKTNRFDFKGLNADEVKKVVENLETARLVSLNYSLREFKQKDPGLLKDTWDDVFKPALHKLYSIKENPMMEIFYVAFPDFEIKTVVTPKEVYKSLEYAASPIINVYENKEIQPEKVKELLLMARAFCDEIESSKGKSTCIEHIRSIVNKDANTEANGKPNFIYIENLLNQGTDQAKLDLVIEILDLAGIGFHDREFEIYKNKFDPNVNKHNHQDFAGKQDLLDYAATKVVPKA